MSHGDRSTDSTLSKVSHRDRSTDSLVIEISRLCIEQRVGDFLDYMLLLAQRPVLIRRSDLVLTEFGAIGHRRGFLQICSLGYLSEFRAIGYREGFS